MVAGYLLWIKDDLANLLQRLSNDASVCLIEKRGGGRRRGRGRKRRRRKIIIIVKIKSINFLGKIIIRFPS
jgi:hypothetical protein